MQTNLKEGLIFLCFRLLEADFAVATVLISFGAILGVASPIQLIIMATFEVLFYNINIYVGVDIFHVSFATFIQL